jgi:hypothetical protein
MNQGMMKWGAAGFALLLAGCGGNGGGSSPSSNLTAGSYQLSFSMAASSASAPVSGVDLTIQLPEEVQVDTTSDGTGRIPGSALSTGSAVSDASLLAGHHIPTGHRVRISLTTAATTAWNGEFARLKIAIPTGKTIAKSKLLETVGENFPAYKVVGLTNSPRSTITLTNYAKTSVAILP